MKKKKNSFGLGSPNNYSALERLPVEMNPRDGAV